MLTITKEYNGIIIERYIDDDRDIEKFKKLIVLKKYFFMTSYMFDKLKEEIDNKNQYYQDIVNVLNYSRQE